MRTFLKSLLALAFITGISLAGFSGAQATMNSNKDIVRIAGYDRYETNAKTIAAAFPDDDSASGAVVVSGENYPDAMACGPLTKAIYGPLALIKSDEIPLLVMNEINRVVPKNKKIYVCGGPDVINTNQIAALTGQGYDVTRIWGDDRYSTSTAAARMIDEKRGTDAKGAFLVNGDSFADPLSIGPWAALNKQVVLLNPADELNQSVEDYLASSGVEHVTIVGGTSVIEDSVVDELEGLGYTTGRIAGDDRYGTSAKVAELFLKEIKVSSAESIEARPTGGTSYEPSGIGLASGEDYPDALGSVFILAKHHWPLLLSEQDEIACLETGLYMYDYQDRLYTGYLFGGTSAIDSETEAAAEGIISGTYAPACEEE